MWESQSEMGVTGAGRLEERRPPGQGCLGRHPVPARPTSEAGTDAKQQGGLPGAGDWRGRGLSWKEDRCWVEGVEPAPRDVQPSPWSVLQHFHHLQKLLLIVIPHFP